MAYGFGVLRSFVNGELVAVPFGDRGDQLNRVLVLRWAIECRIDLDRGFREGPVGIARDDLGDEVLQRRVRLVDDLRALRVERDAEGLLAYTRL